MEQLPVFFQTVNAQEAAETRLERLQSERPVIEQHNERLETSEETATEEPAADLEVRDGTLAPALQLPLALTTIP